MTSNFKRVAGVGVLSILGLFLVIQLVPYGRNHTNPPVVSEPNWDSAQTRALAERACFDCHSNETTWPWYSNVAPVSWLTQIDTDEGRSTLNFSEWGTHPRSERGGELGESIAEGQMPPAIYLVTHPEARLTQAEKSALIQGLQATANQ